MSGGIVVRDGGGGRGVVDPHIARDLGTLALVPIDIDARSLTQIDIDAQGLGAHVHGYKIPYFDAKGIPVRHYRIRQLPDPNIRGDKGGFIRTSKDVTRIYFPKNFSSVKAKSIRIAPADSPDNLATVHTPLLVVDDERLAVHLTKAHGLLSVAIQGPSGWQASAGLADGFKDLCERIRNEQLTIILWIGDGTDRNIQREVANLAMEFKFQGVPFKSIRQYTHALIDQTRIYNLLRPLSKFPSHPDIRSYIQSKIGESGQRLTRKDNMEIGLAILADLEASGVRIKSTTTGDYYYFDNGRRELIKASLESGRKELMNNSPFMVSIYTKYGLVPSDHGILSHFSTQFTSEEPIYQTQSYRTMLCTTRQESTFALQITPSEYIHIGVDKGAKAKIRSNGDLGILFEKPPTGLVPIDVDKLSAELLVQRDHETLPFWWLDVMKEVRTQKELRYRIILALLYYISPWLKGWREIQLPIEVITGAAGTGKSSLFALRLSILSGDPELKNIPDTVRDWHTSVIGTPGLCVFDNVHTLNKVLRQSLSDEMCRLTTEPRPSISMRQLYKTADVAKFPVQCTFGLTSIENVFTNIDFIQRSMFLFLEEPNTGHDETFGVWVSEKLNAHGGREAWLAHHVVALERFFVLANTEWKLGYKSRTRLIHFEQSLILMGKVFGLDIESWLPDLLRDNTRAVAVDIDWVLEGLARFAEDRVKSSRGTSFTAADVVEWASCQDDFDQNYTLTNARRLGRYIVTHKTIVRQTTGITVANSQRRGTSYCVDIAPGAGRASKTNPEGVIEEIRSGPRPRRDDRGGVHARGRKALDRAMEDEDN